MLSQGITDHDHRRDISDARRQYGGLMQQNPGSPQVAARRLHISLVVQAANLRPQVMVLTRLLNHQGSPTLGSFPVLHMPEVVVGNRLVRRAKLLAVGQTRQTSVR